MPERDYHWENNRTWRYESRPYRRPSTPRPVARTRTCIYCAVEFTPSLRQPLDLHDLIVCPPCYARHQERERNRDRDVDYNTKQRNDDEGYNPYPYDQDRRGGPPLDEAPVRRRRSPVKKTKPKDKKPAPKKSVPKDKRPTAWDRILEPMLQA